MIINKSNFNLIPDDRLQYTVDAAPCKNGLLTIVISKDGRERFIHSKYDPVAEARKQTSEIAREVKKSYTDLIFGLGMGYCLYEILKYMPKDGAVHIFEPCPKALKLFLENNNSSILDDNRVNIYSFWNGGGEELENILTLENCDAFVFFAHPVYASVFVDEHNLLVSEINRISSGLLTQKNSIRQYGLNWSVNSLANYRHLYNSAAVKGLFGLFAGKTAIIVSAGPSLSKNVGLLEHAEGRAVIICTDAAFKAVEKANVVPDILVSVSGSPSARFKLEGVTYDVPLVYKSQSSHEILDGHNGPKFYSSYINGFLDDALTEAGIDAGFIDSGGSVACSCLDLAVKTGAGCVVFIGQDFALTEGKVYSENITSPYSLASIEKFTIETTDIYGNPIKTLQNLNIYKHWFENYIKKTRNVRFIDATEGGARIEGTEVMSLGEALDIAAGRRFDIKSKISGAFSENSLESARDIVTHKYAEGYKDFLTAKELVAKLLDDYKRGRITHAKIEDALFMLYDYTHAVRYSILTEIFDIKNKCAGSLPDAAPFKKIERLLDGLTELFQSIVEGN